MNKRNLLLITLFALSLCRAGAVDYNVLPQPQSVGQKTGKPFMLADFVQIIAPDSLMTEAQLLQSYISDLTGLQLTIANKHKKMGVRDRRKLKTTGYITLRVSSGISHPEGYQLHVKAFETTITGGSAAGVFYGIQTLRKALADSANVAMSGAASKSRLLLPPVLITDAPRFAWRGMHLDCSRHFFPVAFVKKFIDLLALHNMNTFHWHLTDDQGWRLELKSWPEINRVGSQRSGTIIGTNSDLDDGQPYGGYYTQAEAREIVRYAAERHITVVPEIDMPGHMLAALASYPELGCTGGPYQVGHYWGVYRDVLCVGNPKVYKFVEDVLREVMDIFPSEVIHIGGDETPTERWSTCQKCQDLGLPTNQLQAYFTQLVFGFLTANNRRALGWDEILDGCPQDAMIMSWRGAAPGAKAAEAGHDVVMTPTTYCYFDYQQVENTLFEPSRCGGFIPIEKVYSFDPAPDSLSVSARSHILGAQANLWSEYMTTESTVEYQALPRMSALAEVQWSQPAQKDFEQFKARLSRFTNLLERYHYTYCKHLWPERQIPNRWQF